MQTLKKWSIPSCTLLADSATCSHIWDGDLNQPTAKSLLFLICCEPFPLRDQVRAAGFLWVIPPLWFCIYRALSSKLSRIQIWISHCPYIFGAPNGLQDSKHMYKYKSAHCDNANALKSLWGYRRASFLFFHSMTSSYTYTGEGA